MMDVRRISDFWRRCDVTVRDSPLAVLLVVAALLPMSRGVGTDVGGLPDRPYDALAVLVIALECLPLAVRRKWPAASLVLVALGFSLDQLLAYHTMAGTALPFALISAGAHLERHRRATAIFLSVAYVPLMVALDRLGGNESPADIVLLFLILVLAWFVGGWLRSTRAAEVERRRHIAAATRAAERTRIARELHDVVTHHVTAMVVQAESARYLTAAPERLDATLSAVTDTGRRAITDLRHLLDLLNPDHDTESGDRTPSAGDLHTLVEQTRRAGQPVEFSEEGNRSESAGSAEFVAYRVVQEALTNALKYAHGSSTGVRVRYREKEITVEVSTDGSGSRTRSPGGSGRGLAGLRERVEALGGTFGADRQPDGGFVVRASIPAGSSS
ncbi:histidine kinase [Nonomuraea sp. NPDC050404]|uniref:sensor histidine kinase n=1 Tax=Nonomuraea sp. NPDC050404 TaxID=3155783 RepID=UPI0033DD9A26